MVHQRSTIAGGGGGGSGVITTTDHRSQISLPSSVGAVSNTTNTHTNNSSPSRSAPGRRPTSVDGASARRHGTLTLLLRLSLLAGVVVGSLVLIVTSTHATTRSLQQQQTSLTTTVLDSNSNPTIYYKERNNDGNVTSIQAVVETSVSATTAVEAAATTDDDDNAAEESMSASSTTLMMERALPTTYAPRIPSILLAGTQKASTSAVAVYLMKLNQTCFSDPDQGEEGGHGKESHFFDLKYDGGLALYQSLFHKCQEDDRLIDGTPETMLHPQRVRDIYTEQGTMDEVKILFILREPVERSVSWYNHQLRYATLPNRPEWTNGIVDSKNNNRIKSYIEHQRSTVAINFKHRQYDKLYGYYAHWLKEWSAVFDRRRQILVVAYAELVHNPARMLRRIHDFLEIPYHADTDVMELTNENTNVKKTPPPPCEHQLEMAKYFDGPNRELYKFLEDHPGPVMEQRPFPKFKVACRARQSAVAASH